MGPVQLINLALSHLKINRLIQTVDERSPEAQQGQLWYDQCRASVLAGFDWTFARASDALASAPDPTQGNWAFCYLQPMDCVRARYIKNPLLVDTRPGVIQGPWHLHRQWDRQNDVPFQRFQAADGQRRLIMCNIQEPILTYTRDTPLLEVWDPLAIQAFSHYLAMYMSGPLIQRADVRKEQFQFYNSTIKQAEAEDANSETEQPPPEAEAIRGRW